MSISAFKLQMCLTWTIGQNNVWQTLRFQAEESLRSEILPSSNLIDDKLLEYLVSAKINSINETGNLLISKLKDNKNNMHNKLIYFMEPTL